MEFQGLRPFVRFNFEHKRVDGEIKISQPKAIEHPCPDARLSQVPGGGVPEEISQAGPGPGARRPVPCQTSGDPCVCAFLTYKGKNTV